VIDDVLDFTGKSTIMGKPALNDIRAGVVTCPVLFAAEEYPELVPMMARKFSNAGDVERANELVKSSKGLDRARQLAEDYVRQAIGNIDALGPCKSTHAEEARRALRQLCERVIQRNK
jgi:geranylgeranyl pyrophosphate synthase